MGECPLFPPLGEVRECAVLVLPPCSCSSPWSRRCCRWSRPPPPRRSRRPATRSGPRRELAGQVPTAEEVIGFPLGERDVTVAESDAYLQAVAAASPRVTAGTAAVSWQGRPLRYAIVGKPGNVTPAGLARIRLQTALLHDPRTPAKLAAPPGQDHPGHPLGGRQRPRRRGERHRRRPAGHVRAGRPARLRGRPDPRQRHRGPAPDPEPGRPRGRHPAQRLRLRPEPRLVRPHPARDRRQARAAPPLPAGAVHRRPRDGPGELLLPAQRRPHLPRDHRRVDRLDQQPVRPGHGRRVHPPGHPVLQPGRLRPVLHGLRRHRALDRVHLRRHDLREGQRRPDLAAGARAVPDPVGVAVLGGGQRRRHPGPLARRLGRGPAPGPGRGAGAQRDRQPRQRAGHPGARPAPAALVPARRRPVQGRRAARPGPAPAADGRQGLPAPASRSTVPDYKAYGRAPRAARLPAGTYWVPMAQAQKHWVQAMLNEDTYTPFPYFYDVTGWSNPLLFNLGGGSSGAVLDPARGPGAPAGATPGGRGPRPTRRRSACTSSTRAPRPSSPPAGCATCSTTSGGCPTGSWTPPPSPPAA